MIFPSSGPGIIAFAVLAYVILDGFDLGVGILFPFFPEKHDKDLMMNSVAPVWDGNETWLVLGGGGLLAVFPLAYATILPALYAPLIIMLLGLILPRCRFLNIAGARSGRSICGTMPLPAARWSPHSSRAWRSGALVQGIPVTNRAYSGGWWNWLTPFSIATGFALLIGYGLLGSTWLVMKTSGHLAERAKFFAFRLAFATVAAMGVFSLWTALAGACLSRPLVRLSDHGVLDHRAGAGAGLPVADRVGSAQGAGQQALLCRAWPVRARAMPGSGSAFYPYIVPTSLTIWEAAAPDESLSFLLYGAVVLVPMILCYTAYAYWVFRGKLKPG